MPHQYVLTALEKHTIRYSSRYNTRKQLDDNLLVDALEHAQVVGPSSPLLSKFNSNELHDIQQLLKTQFDLLEVSRTTPKTKPAMTVENAHDTTAHQNRIERSRLSS